MFVFITQEKANRLLDRLYNTGEGTFTCAVGTDIWIFESTSITNEEPPTVKNNIKTLYHLPLGLLAATGKSPCLGFQRPGPHLCSYTQAFLYLFRIRIGPTFSWHVR